MAQLSDYSVREVSEWLKEGRFHFYRVNEHVSPAVTYYFLSIAQKKSFSPFTSELALSLWRCTPTKKRRKKKIKKKIKCDPDLPPISDTF